MGRERGRAVTELDSATGVLVGWGIGRMGDGIHGWWLMAVRGDQMGEGVSRRGMEMEMKKMKKMIDLDDGWRTGRWIKKIGDDGP